MSTPIEEGFLDYFKDLEDPRAQRNRLYNMSEILLVTLCAAICGQGLRMKNKKGLISLKI